MNEANQPISLLPILEAAIFAAGEPVTVQKLCGLFPEEEPPSKQDIRTALKEIQERYQGQGVELVETASGYRFQAKECYAPWLQRLWEKKPAKYSRAFLETLALIVYQQPTTRGEIEAVRGVTVSTNIIKTLLEYEWITIVGHKETPGRPALYGTTKSFLDYFGLSSLSELPPLQEVVDLEATGKAVVSALASGQQELPLALVQNEQGQEEASSELAAIDQVESCEHDPV